jgi:hypothetical protein
MKHSHWMLIACIVPLLLIFILPALGIGLGGWSLMLIMIACFAMHLLMMSGRSRHGNGGGT